MAFCSDGSPWQGLAAAFWRVPMWTCGLPRCEKITFSALVTPEIEEIKPYISLASLLSYHQKNNLIIVHTYIKISVNFFTLVFKNHKMLLFITLFHLVCFFKKGVSFKRNCGAASVGVFSSSTQLMMKLGHLMFHTLALCHLLWWRAKAWNICFGIFLQGPIWIMNSVGQNKLYCNLILVTFNYFLVSQGQSW